MTPPRWPGYSRKAEVAWVRAQRTRMLANLACDDKRALAERLAATRKLFDRPLFIGDLHCHSTFSDGVSTVAENKRMADLLGLDFLFITDHRTLRHKRSCDPRRALWWGQEPPTKDREIGLLLPRSLFVPKCDSVERDFLRARARSPFAWIPHPVGYGRAHWYAEDVVAGLWKLGDSFPMEVLNGSSKLSRAYNAVSAKAVRVWDALLCDKRQVTALGVSDAHICYSLGTAWTGVYASSLTAKAIVTALARGHCFASEAPLLWLSCGRARMGESVFRKPGGAVRMRFAAADSLGLHSVRIICGGKVVKELSAGGAPQLSGVFEQRVRRLPAYFRLECAALDQRRAFSSPIYVSAS